MVCSLPCGQRWRNDDRPGSRGKGKSSMGVLEQHFFVFKSNEFLVCHLDESCGQDILLFGSSKPPSWFRSAEGDKRSTRNLVLPMFLPLRNMSQSAVYLSVSFLNRSVLGVALYVLCRFSIAILLPACHLHCDIHRLKTGRWSYIEHYAESSDLDCWDRKRGRCLPEFEEELDATLSSPCW